MNTLWDKQWCHLYSYLTNTINTKLVANADKREIGNLRLEAFPDADMCGTSDITESTSSGLLALLGDHMGHLCS